MKSILIFGRQPELGLAEAESLFGAENIHPISSAAAVIDIDPCNLTFKRLGGSVKLAKLLVEIPSSDWQTSEKFLIENSPTHVLDMPPGKMKLGISAYNFNKSPKDIMASALKIKKAIQTTGRSVRVIPNTTQELNSASVIHNGLIKDKGWELLIIKSSNKTYIGQTILVQNINAYAKRDQVRPKRDARVGMLPPKLAQIIINLASPKLKIEEGKEECVPINPNYDNTVLDPFCGSGVILQEALLMGLNASGSDIDERMVEYSKENLNWLKQNYDIPNKAKISLKNSDAINGKWQDFDFVATETTLGKPLSSIPDKAELGQIVEKTNKLITDFLINLHGQVKSGSKHCIAIPAWKNKDGELTLLPLIDHLGEIGYNSVDFKHLNGAGQLIYYRPDQFVGRHLLVINRN